MAKWLTVQNKANEPTEMIINGPIGRSWWDDTGVAANEFRQELDEIPKGQKINVRINSEGGSIKDGLEIYNALKDRRKDVTAYIDGYALSIASIIPLAAARVISPRASIWMIHEPWSYTQGDAEEHRKSADMLDKHGEVLAGVYADETGKSRSEIRQAMQAETWMSGEDAVVFGLADESPEDDETVSQNRLVKKFKSFWEAVPRNTSAFNSAFGKEPISISAPKQGGVVTNQNQIMDKKKLVALLKKHGVEASTDWTDDQFDSALNKIGITDPKPAGDTAVADLKAQLEKERRARIQARVVALGEGRIANEDIPFWTDLMVNDEEGIAKRIQNMPVVHPGAGPAPHYRIELGDNPVDSMKKQFPKAQDQYRHMVNNWAQLMEDAEIRDGVKRDYKGNIIGGTRSLPRNDNTYSATLVTNFLITGAITNLQNRWAPLMVFAKDFSTDPYKPLSTAQIKNVTVGPTVQTNATNFESGDSTVAPISVTMAQYSSAAHVTNSELNSGLRMEDLVTITTAKLADKVTEVATAPITVANFASPAAETFAAAAFSYPELAILWGKLKKSPIKNLLLDGEYLARIINNPTFYQPAGLQPGGGWRAFGWDYIALNTDWTGAGANVVGFACNPQAICAVSGLPVTPPEGIPGNTLQVNTITLPDVGISIALYSWFALASRTAWVSYDIMFGAAKADTTAGVILKSA